MLAAIGLIVLAVMVLAALALAIIAIFGALPGNPLGSTGTEARDFLRDNHPFGSYTDDQGPCGSAILDEYYKGPMSTRKTEPYTGLDLQRDFEEPLGETVEKARGGPAPYTFRGYA